MATEQEAQDWLAHHGVLGQKWGVHKAGTDSGISSRSLDRQAAKDAKEHVQAKLYYGDGAGTRRKLIKAKVESQSAKSADYKKAFDYHVAQQDVGKRLSQVKGQRARATARASTAKTSRGLINIARGNPQAAGASLAAVAAGAALVHKTGLDKKAFNAAVNSPAGKVAINRGKQLIAKLI